jgi:methylated-DNA-[protein]-cysteine S-methyltransferase
MILLSEGRRKMFIKIRPAQNLFACKSAISPFTAMMFLQYVESPVGWVEITAEDKAIVSVLFFDRKEKKETHSSLTQDCARQMHEYFRSERKRFELPLHLSGTEFQSEVWSELQKIPFGKTISYLELARRLGDEKKIRAAATANGRNPVSILVPCHRVIGSDGSLVGYGGGLWRKKWLLEFESGRKQTQLAI